MVVNRAPHAQLVDKRGWLCRTCTWAASARAAVTTLGVGMGVGVGLSLSVGLSCLGLGVCLRLRLRLDVSGLRAGVSTSIGVGGVGVGLSLGICLSVGVGLSCLGLRVRRLRLDVGGLRADHITKAVVHQQRGGWRPFCDASRSNSLPLSTLAAAAGAPAPVSNRALLFVRKDGRVRTRRVGA